MKRRLGIILVIAAVGLVILLAAFVKLAYAPEHTEGEANPPAQISRLSPLPGTVEVASTSASRILGLSGRTELPDDYGLLFIFDEVGPQGFWMKDMHLSIDIIWISESGTILHIERDVSPATYPTIFNPEVPARYVLETPSGYAKERKWDVGTELDISQYR